MWKTYIAGLVIKVMTLKNVINRKNFENTGILWNVPEAAQGGDGGGSVHGGHVEHVHGAVRSLELQVQLVRPAESEEEMRVC